MSVRTKEIALGYDFRLKVNKTDANPAVYVPLGCAKSIESSLDKEILEANCFSGLTQIASGQQAKEGFSVSGFVFIYATANVAGNVSAAELKQWARDGVTKQYQFAGIHVGDPVETFSAVISNFSQTAAPEGIAEYSFSLVVDGTPVTSIVTA